MALNPAGLCSLLHSRKLKHGDLNDWSFFFSFRGSTAVCIRIFFSLKKIIFLRESFFFSNFPQSKNGDNLFEINLKKGEGV